MYTNPVFITSESLLKFCPLKHKKAKYNSDGELVQPLKIMSNQFNIGQLLRFHPYWRDRLVWDDLARAVYINHTAPVRYETCDNSPIPLPYNPNPADWRQYTDLDAYIFVDWLQDWYDVKTDKQTVLAAVSVVSREVAINPLKSYIEELEPWDPKVDEPKLDTWLIRYFGVIDTVLARSYARKTLISILARIFLSTIDYPIKVDSVLSLYGGQGIKKSTALAALCFQRQFGRRYFSDQAIDMSQKDAVLTIQGKVIYELKELAKRSKDRNLEKAFIDNQIDRIRSPFNRLVEDFVRITVFIITTNDQEFLTDPTGSRRFWPLECAVGWERDREINAYDLELEAQDLWREAYYYLKQYIAHDNRLQENKEKRLSPGANIEALNIERTEILQDREPYIWWLTKEEELLRENEALQFTDQHPLTQRVLSEAKLNGSPITLDKIMGAIYPDVADKTRQNKAIIKDILLTQGYKQYRFVHHDNTTERAWKK